MCKDTTLVIMAAGIGSRFGTGIKQLSKMSSHGEIIIDYSIHDAMEAGFNKVVFIIRKDIEKEFKEVIGERISKFVNTEYVFQELDDLPAGFSLPEERRKPWGTGQAVLCCKGVVKEPFVIINADDYYGKDAFVKLHDFLIQEEPSKENPSKEKLKLAMAGFILKNTLSDNGTVTRGVCLADENHMLTKVVETKGIEAKDGKVTCNDPAVEEWISLDSKVSMNMWAAFPDFLDVLEAGFVEFLGNPANNLEKDEYLLPIYIGDLLKQDRVTVKVLETNDKWIGITYKEDTELAQAGFREMIANGIYPEKLWNE